MLVIQSSCCVYLFIAKSTPLSADGSTSIDGQEVEHEKLQTKLRNMLMERKRDAKKAFDVAGQMQKRLQQQATQDTEGRRPSARADEETYRVRAGGHPGRCLPGGRRTVPA